MTFGRLLRLLFVIPFVGATLNANEPESAGADSFMRGFDHSLPSPAEVVLSDLEVSYDSLPKTPTVTSTPSGVAFKLLYDGLPAPPTAVGRYTVTAVVTDSNYIGGASGVLTIHRARPVIAWPTPADITYGTPLAQNNLNATANVPGTFKFYPAAGTVLGVGLDQELRATFTPDDQASFEPMAVTTFITVNKASAVIALNGLTQTYDGAPKSVSALTVPANLKVIVAYGGADRRPVFPGEYPVTATVDDPNYSGSTLETMTVSVTALVRHAPIINGSVDGSVQVMSGENVLFRGNAWVSGDVLVPGTPSLALDGFPMVAGTYDEAGAATPSNYSVTLAGSSIIRYLVRRIPAPSLPQVSKPSASKQTLDLTLTSRDSIPSTFVDIRNLVLDGDVGTVALTAGTYGDLLVKGSSTVVLGRVGSVDPSIYFLQSLSVADTAQVQVIGPVLLVLANGARVGGIVGNAAHPQWLTFAVATGGVTWYSGSQGYAYVVAPLGRVAIAHGASLIGQICADRLLIESGGTLADPEP